MELIDYILQDIILKLDNHNIPYIVKKSNNTNSVYIKIYDKYYIRISDHYKKNDAKYNYNIGPHINSFKRLKGSYYFKYDRTNQLIIRLIKDLKDKKYINNI